MKEVYKDSAAPVHRTAKNDRQNYSCPGDKPRILQSSTANFVPAFGCQMSFLLVLASGETFKRRVFDALAMPWGVKKTLVSWANNSVSTQSCPAKPCRSAVHPDPTRAWRVQVSDSTGNKNKNNLSNPKPGHTTGESGRSARRSGRARSGKIECQQNYSPREQRSIVPSRAPKKRFNVFPEARTSEFSCKPTEEQNQWLTRGLSPVYQRFINRTRSALWSWLPTSGTTPFRLCKALSCEACPGIVSAIRIATA